MTRADALSLIRTRGARTPQNRQADARQVRNSAGGYTFTVSGETRILRFLTLGVEGGTYYIKPRDLVLSNGTVLMDWARNRSTDLVRLATEVSEAGRAPRNDPALFAVMAAMALGDEAGRQAAAEAFPRVARIGTHVFSAAGYLEQFRGWGPVARRAFARWYLDKDADKLAYQMAKYRHRNDWTHGQVLAMAHPKPRAADGSLMAVHDALFAWATGHTPEAEMPRMVAAYERARFIERTGNTKAAKARMYAELVRDVPGIAWEMLPDEAVTQAEVWRALIDNGMPITALMRQLPRMTRLGVFESMVYARTVAEALTDGERLRKGRVHPVAILIAARTYSAGRSEKGSSTWTPVPVITAALNDGFYGAFPAVEPSGKRTMIALDVSGSMRSSAAGYNLQAAEVTAAMSLVVMKTEPFWGVYGFNQGIAQLNLHPRMALEDVARRVSGLTYGGTDCALPMVWAAHNKVEVDTFQVWTDNETWAGQVHPHEALADYAQKMGIPARLQVIATTPTEFSIADPDNPGMIDISGFDADVPVLLANHARGDV